MNQKIVCKGEFEHVEHPASAALSPGHLVELLSTGKVRKHATAGGFAETAFAEEDALQGRTVDTAYAADEPVMIAIAQRGAIVRARLAPGVAYTKGMRLISAGDGTLTQVDASEKQVIAVCTEALDLSASGAVATLSPVRVA